MIDIEWFFVGFMSAVLLMFSWACYCYKQGWDQANCDWVKTDNDDMDKVIEIEERVYKAVSVDYDDDGEVVLHDMFEQEREEM